MNELPGIIQCFPTAIDLFSGAGGLSAGFEQAGFRLLAANDLDEYASATYRVNNPKTRFLSGPLERISAEDFLGAVGLRHGELDALIAGLPCQAFSVNNHQRGIHDQRSGLFRDYLRIVSGIMPRFVVIENVTGIASTNDGIVFDEIMNKLSGLGYCVDARILRAEEYGVPQERRRVFFLGTRDSNSVKWPKPTHTGYDHILRNSRDLKPLITVADAISDLPPLAYGQGLDEMPYTEEAHSEYQRMLRAGSRCVFNHVAARLGPINRERITHIPQGGSWRDLPHHLLPTGMKRARRSDHTKRYGRLHPDRQACTILTKCDLHWGAYIHPEQSRTLTVREAARLQSFPDSFRFKGNKSEQYKQVGNAVPPLVAQSVANAILAMMTDRMLPNGSNGQVVV